MHRVAAATIGQPERQRDGPSSRIPCRRSDDRGFFAWRFAPSLSLAVVRERRYTVRDIRRPLRQDRTPTMPRAHLLRIWETARAWVPAEQWGEFHSCFQLRIAYAARRSWFAKATTREPLGVTPSTRTGGTARPERKRESSRCLGARVSGARSQTRSRRTTVPGDRATSAAKASAIWSEAIPRTARL